MRDVCLYIYTEIAQTFQFSLGLLLSPLHRWGWNLTLSVKCVVLRGKILMRCMHTVRKKGRLGGYSLSPVRFGLLIPDLEFERYDEINCWYWWIPHGGIHHEFHNVITWWNSSVGLSTVYFIVSFKLQINGTLYVDCYIVLLHHSNIIINTPYRPTLFS